MSGTEGFRAALAACADPAVPPNVALMRLLGEAGSPEEAEAPLRAGAERGDARAAALLGLLRAHPEAWATVRSVLAEAHHAPGPGEAADAVARWRDAFDRVAARSAEAGSALYALGSPALLEEATAEVVTLLRGLGLVEPGRDVVELGCGSGRFLPALAASSRSVLGLDVSAGMVAAARRRCAGIPNVAVRRTSGHDLAALAEGSADLLLASDVFPYLVLAGGGLAEGHVRDAARILRPGGRLAIFNWSYRGEVALDRRDFAEACAAAGLAAERNGSRDLRLWDAATFLARKG